MNISSQANNLNIEQNKDHCCNLQEVITRVSNLPVIKKGSCNVL